MSRDGIIVAVLFLTSCVVQPIILGSPQTPDTTGSKEIEVKIIPTQKSIRVGEALKLRVEISNVSSKPLFIEQVIYELCVPSPLSFRLDLGPPLKPQTGPGHGCAAHCVYGIEDSFAKRLVDRWISLPPGSFYGKEVALSPDFFPQLNTPGRWRLSGSYKSMGGLSTFRCFDAAPIPDIKEQIKRLTFEAWQGQVDTNTAWIEVMRAETPGRVNKSP